MLISLTLPIAIFCFGLMLVLIHNFSAQIMIWLGQFGILLVAFAQLWLLWQGWALMIISYLFAGYMFADTLRAASFLTGSFRIRMPRLLFVFWILAWPILIFFPNKHSF